MRRLLVVEDDPSIRESLEDFFAGRGDQVGCQALRIVQQHFQEMLAGQPLVVAAQRQRLGGLDEAAGPVGVLL